MYQFRFSLYLSRQQLQLLATFGRKFTTYCLPLILCATLLLVSSCKTPTSKVDNPADLIYYNGNILTMVDENRQVEAIAVKDGKILEVGKQDAVGKHNGETTQMIDLDGKTLLPGFIDGHSHFSFTTTILDLANLNSPPVGTVKSIPDIIAKLKEHQEERSIPKGEWIVGWGYDQDQLVEKRHPNKLDMDEAFPDNPVYLMHVSGHLSTVNSKALEASKIDGKMPDPPGGVIVRLPNSNEPSGVLQETASSAMRGRIPTPDAAQLMDLIQQAQDYYASRGITTAQDGLTDMKTMQLLQKVAEADKFKIDVEALASFQYAKEFIGNPDFPFGTSNNGFRIAGLKIVSDGSPQGKTAYFSKPYLTEVPGCMHDCRGFPILELEPLTQLVSACYQNDIQLFTHCNGDGAIDLFFEAHEKAVAALPAPKDDLRSVIIHSQFVRPDQLEKYAEYKMIPSFFTNHAFFWGDVHLENLGEERASFLSPLKTATDMGITYTNHTDFMVTPLNQLFLLWSAVNRTTRSGKVLGSDERISPWQGLKAITINSAYQHQQEEVKGTLEVGKLADFVVLDQDPLTVQVDDIKDIKVVETIKEGSTIYKL